MSGKYATMNVSSVKKSVYLFCFSFGWLLFFAAPIQAASASWTQTDWSGGSGQTNWSDGTKFSASSNAAVGTSGQITISDTHTTAEEFSNSGFETDLTGWSTPSYALDDQFSTDKVAGEVNGTLAEPTGGVRTVVDTEGKLSISNGLLSIIRGKTVSPGYGDPAI